MKNLRFIWFGLSILTLILFIFCTSFTLFFKYGVYISMVGGVISAFFLFLGICNIQKISELTDKENPKTNKGLGVYIAFFSFILFGIFIHIVLGNRLETKLKDEGQFTKAIVTGGSSTTRKSRRGTATSYMVRVAFKDTIKNKEYSFPTDVDAEIFNSLYEDQEIEIKFLPDEPEVFKLMVGDENLRKFKNIKIRKLNFQDIEKIFFSEDIEKEVNFLNSISYGW